MTKLSEWLQKQGVPPGQWYVEAKAFARAAMRAAGLSSDAFLVLTCLRLHTMPYQSELAVTMAKGKRLVLTPGNIGQETGLTRQNVRRSLAELEAAGFAQRKPIVEGGLRKGNVQVHCWTVPHPPGRSGKVVKPDYNLPPTIVALVRQFRIPLPDDFVATGDYKAFVIAAAERYKEARVVAASKLKEAFFVAPGAPAYKEERKSLKEGVERTSSPGGRASTSVGTPATETPARPQLKIAEKQAAFKPPDPPWYTRLREILQALPIGTDLDEPMFRRIASHLTEELLDQYATESRKAVDGIRKWSGYEGIAKQVAKRGLVQSAGAGTQEDPLLKRLKEDEEMRKSWLID